MKLTEMSLEELWELFPIVLVPYDAGWPVLFEEKESEIRESLFAYPVSRISHIGSTAIEDMWAKPIVDILVELKESSDLESAAHALEGEGFIIMDESASRISLNCGYTPEGFAEKVFHVHLRHVGDNDELYFRDYLLDHADVARSYEELKLRLWKKYEKNRDAYTDAKAEFVNEWTKVAREIYRGRY